MVGQEGHQENEWQDQMDKLVVEVEVEVVVDTTKDKEIEVGSPLPMLSNL